jgi:hypothetical protein
MKKKNSGKMLCKPEKENKAQNDRLATKAHHDTCNTDENLFKHVYR